MPDIFQDFPIKASAEQVFEAVSTPEGLAAWWAESSSGKREQGAEYDLGFGPGYEWRARVSLCEPDREFELELTSADTDWQGTRLGFQLDEMDGVTQVRFHHTGWPESNEHYRVSCFAFLDGLSPETIAAECFPVLTLEQVFGAITYYLGHRTEIDEYLKNMDAEFKALRQSTREADPDFHAKLLKARRESLMNQA